MSCVLAAPPPEDASSAAKWIVVAIVVGLIAFVVRRVVKASDRRIGRGETERAPPKEPPVEADEPAVKPSKAPKNAPEPVKEPEPPPPPPEPKVPKAFVVTPGDGATYRKGLEKTRDEGFVGRLGKLFKGKQIDEALLDGIEEVLFTADIGVRTSQKLIDGLKAGLSRKELADEDAVWRHLEKEAADILVPVCGAPGAHSLVLAGRPKPYVVLVIGVNGSGKTTTIGKLCHKLVHDGHRVLVGAGDTFRAAAVDQVGIWTKRVGADLFEGKDGADPSSVLFDSVKHATAEGHDIVICDTAGRLHTNAQLVDELKKVKRVIAKAQPGAPHEVLLVLDATNGQNAIAQAQAFGQELGVTGIVLTKLDGTAKGGVVLGIVDELRIPVRWVGIGERTEDLRPFDARAFVQALFGGAANNGTSVHGAS